MLFYMPFSLICNRFRICYKLTTSYALGFWLPTMTEIQKTQVQVLAGSQFTVEPRLTDTPEKQTPTI